MSPDELAVKYMDAIEGIEARIAAEFSGLVGPLASHGSEDLDAAVADLFWTFNRGPRELMQVFGVDRYRFWYSVAKHQHSRFCPQCSGLFFMHYVDADHEKSSQGLVILCPGCSAVYRRADADETARANRVVDDMRAREKAQEEARIARVAELKAMPYGEYLQTEHWQQTRLVALERDGYACRVCGSTESLNVHHRTYDRRGEEAPGDMTTLCQPCHQLFHDNLKLVRAEG